MRVLVAIALSVVLLTSSCGDTDDSGGGDTTATPTSTTTSAPPTTYTCPDEFPATTEATLPPGNLSSATVYGGSKSLTAGGAPWCGTIPLTAKSEDVAAIVAQIGCPDGGPAPCEYEALLALNVTPNGIDFSPHSPSSLWPDLRYDLEAFGDRVEDLDFEIFQVVNDPATLNPVDWLPVGDAELSTFAGKSVAIGSIDHFSIFALVQLPDPQVPPAIGFEAIVASDFRHEAPQDGNEPIRVAFRFEQEGIGDLGIEPPATRIFRLSDVDPSGITEECLREQPIAASLTCQFPIGTPVNLQLDPTTMGIESLDSGVVVELFASAVEIY